MLDDLEIVWQVASKDNRRMQETVRLSNSKLQRHLRLCTRLPGGVITAAAAADEALSAILDADVENDNV